MHLLHICQVQLSLSPLDICFNDSLIPYLLHTARAVEDASNSGVDPALTEAMKEALVREEAAQGLSQAFKSAGRATAIGFIRSGGSKGDGPSGTAIFMLHQAEADLNKAITEARRVGLPRKSIEEAEKALAKLRQEIPEEDQELHV